MFKKIIGYIFVSVLLVLAYPLDLDFPTGNQCIYFFWGIKNTGFGFLADDLLAAQADPFPLFSLLVTYSSKIFGNTVFLFWYWLLNLVYVIAFFEIMEEVVKQKRWTGSSFVENVAVRLALFLFIHCTFVWGFFFSRFFNLDLRWIWDSGFAEQGFLRGYFQPSCFGVFMLLSFMFFVKRKFLPAFIAAAFAACFHANYLLVSAVFIAIYVLCLVREKNYKTAIIGSAISLLIVLPYIIYVYNNFGSSSPETTDYIRSHIKGHIHFDYHTWMNTKAFLQAILIMLSLWLTRKTVFFFPLLASFIILAALTLLTYLSGSIFLLNLTPWRISTVLVPIAAAIAIAYISSLKNAKLYYVLFSLFITTVLSALYFRVFGNSSAEFMMKWRIFTGAGFIVVTVVLLLSGKYLHQLNLKMIMPAFIIFLVVGLGSSGFLLHKEDKKNERELIAFARANLLKGQQYIVPTDMRDFRLGTGTPVFADSTVYHSNSLPEWEKRVKTVNRIYSETIENRLLLLDSLSKQVGVTHIIARGGTDFSPLKQVFHNERYTIFELNKKPLDR